MSLFYIHVVSQRQVPYSFLFKPFPWICSNYNVTLGELTLFVSIWCSLAKHASIWY